jgi:hypothetical protein
MKWVAATRPPTILTEDSISNPKMVRVQQNCERGEPPDNVPFDWQLYGDNELTILRRRIDRLKKRFGLPSPAGSKTAAA